MSIQEYVRNAKQAGEIGAHVAVILNYKWALEEARTPEQYAKVMDLARTYAIENLKKQEDLDAVLTLTKLEMTVLKEIVVEE
ncbi:hypothetical protein ISS09_05135 [Candidatus Woesearchaeota archaeon]|nr:hypothetical protein [Candidatus Woesearchaeota archaeon]